MYARTRVVCDVHGHHAERLGVGLHGDHVLGGHALGLLRKECQGEEDKYPILAFTRYSFTSTLL